MYNIITIQDDVAVPPKKFNLDLDESVKESIAEKYEGMINSEIGFALSIVKVNEVGEGKVEPGDPSVHYPVTFNLLSWIPLNHEIVEGEVVDITEWGAFIRCGPVDGLTHISQVMDDFVSLDEKNAQLAGKTSRRILKVGDKCKARIISISLKEQNKIGLTMRQPFLGSLKWLIEKPKDEKEKPKKETKKKVKKK